MSCQVTQTVGFRQAADAVWQILPRDVKCPVITRRENNTQFRSHPQRLLRNVHAALPFSETHVDDHRADVWIGFQQPQRFVGILRTKRHVSKRGQSTHGEVEHHLIVIDDQNFDVIAHTGKLIAIGWKNWRRFRVMGIFTFRIKFKSFLSIGPIGVVVSDGRMWLQRAETWREAQEISIRRGHGKTGFHLDPCVRQDDQNAGQPMSDSDPGKIGYVLTLCRHFGCHGQIGDVNCPLAGLLLDETHRSSGVHAAVSGTRVKAQTKTARASRCGIL